MLKRPNLMLLLSAALALAACGGNPTRETEVISVPTPVQSVVAAPTDAALAEAPAPSAPDELPPVTLDVVIWPAPAECGAEAAITFAQTQADLAVAALAVVDQSAGQSQQYTAQVGMAAFGAAYDTLAAYAVPECLAAAHAEGLAFMQARVDGYRALAAGDGATYEQFLSEGELARQAMVQAIDVVLAQQ